MGSSSSDDWGRAVGACAARLVEGLLHDLHALRWGRTWALGQIQNGPGLSPWSWLAYIASEVMLYCV